MNKYLTNAESFLKKCLFDGLAHSYDTKTNTFVKPYPEVTGYVIKYLCDYCDASDDDNVKAARKKLIELQHKKGGYRTFFNNRYLFSFDTAQIINGLCSLYSKKPDSELLNTIKKGGNFLLKMQMPNGSFYPVYDCYLHCRRKPKEMYNLWDGPISGINCKITETLSSCYEVTGDKRFKEAIEIAGSFYKKSRPLKHTHPLGYWLEGLYQVGEVEFVKEFLIKEVLPRIEDNGFISYDGTLDYSYMSGEIQLAILLAKVGQIDAAKRIRNFARIVQQNNCTGGIIQYATRSGEIDNHVHAEVNSWGTKYFCELERILQSYEKDN